LDAEYLKRMEDILDLYAQPFMERRPVICLDEFSIQLLDEKIEPIKASPGKVRKEDYEYVREGTRSVFMIVEPLAGKRRVVISEHRGKQEFTEVIRQIAEEWYPPESYDEIVLVMDNLNTHRLSSMYEFFEPSRARSIISRIDPHYTPVHASWLNMAEIEIGAVMTQCLRRRINSERRLREELTICVNDRNSDEKKIHWEFTCEQARTKMGRHYSSVRKERKEEVVF
jgi:hypothetical protein